MKKLNYFTAGFMLLGCVSLVSTKVLADKINSTSQIKPNIQNSITIDPFDNDPFFQDGADVFSQMERMQNAMNKLMKNHFNQMQNNINSNYSNQKKHIGNYSNIEIKENKDNLTYKIKLPKGSDNKVDVSVKNGHLLIKNNITQKITREENNSKSVSYSLSSNTQSFPLPAGYDSKSLTTKIKGANLIISFKKMKS